MSKYQEFMKFMHHLTNSEGEVQDSYTYGPSGFYTHITVESGIDHDFEVFLFDYLVGKEGSKLRKGIETLMEESPIGIDMLALVFKYPGNYEMGFHFIDGRLSYHLRTVFEIEYHYWNNQIHCNSWIEGYPGALKQLKALNDSGDKSAVNFFNFVKKYPTTK